MTSEGLRDMSIIPDEFISGTPDTPNSPVTDVRSNGLGWVVPVPKKPTDPKPTITLKLTDHPEGVELIKVKTIGNVEKTTILAQLPTSEEFHPIRGGANITEELILETFDQVTAIRIIFESPRINTNGKYPEDYRAWLEIVACYHLSGNLITNVSFVWHKVMNDKYLLRIKTYSLDKQCFFKFALVIWLINP